MSEPFPPDIKKRLIWAWHRAEKNGVTQPFLAKELKVSTAAVQQWFSKNGKGVSVGRLIALCHLLDVNVLWLISGQGEPGRAYEMTPDDALLLQRYKKLHPADRRRLGKFLDELLEFYKDTDESFQEGA
jgi:transcriptional regulator with XRE-family HTH domain